MIDHAVITWQDDGTPYSPRFGDVYHARAGAQGQTRHVFLGGNGLPRRWRASSRAGTAVAPGAAGVARAAGAGFTILETGFGLGGNFLSTWDAWRTTEGALRPLRYIGIEEHPPCPEDLERAHAGTPLEGLARVLVAHWPAPAPGMHPISFSDGAVSLLLVFADALAAATALAQPQPALRPGEPSADMAPPVDAFFLDGFAPARNPRMWSPELMSALARLAAPGATAATWSSARRVREALVAAGFEATRAPGYAGKREMTVARLRMGGQRAQ